MSNYFLLAARREIADAAYADVCEAMMRHPNNEIQAIGKIMASVSPSAGMRALGLLLLFLQERCLPISSPRSAK
jgi:hypothetical protein